jgi:uncharacterized protein
VASLKRLHIRATPSARRDEIVGFKRDAAGLDQLIVKVTAQPEKGKANEAIIALLAKTFHVPKQAFQLQRGDTQRNKVFDIKSYNAEIEVGLTDIRNAMPVTDR